VSSFLDKKAFFHVLTSNELGKLLSDSEEKPYSSIFASLNHPVRRKILKMLSRRPMSFSEILEVLGVSSSFLTYHIENLGELVNKTDESKYRLSSFGEAAIATMIKVEEIPRAKPSRLDRALRMSLKQLLAIVLVALIASGSLAWTSDRTETHKRWASMIKAAQQFQTHFRQVYLRFFNVAINWTTISPLAYFWFEDELDYADQSMTQLIMVDRAHANELYTVQRLIYSLKEAAVDGPLVNGPIPSDLRDAVDTISWKLPEAYWRPLNSTGINLDTGPPFWYFGPSPPDEALLQQIATLAVQANQSLNPSV
jgi:DNA-binding transcriptional ArsR family regulator